jgi:hypothetical protein
MSFCILYDILYPENEDIEIVKEDDHREERGKTLEERDVRVLLRNLLQQNWRSTEHSPSSTDVGSLS